MSSEVDISNLRAMYAATTQSEWQCHIFKDQTRVTPSMTADDWRFCCRVHNVWPALLDELERLRAYRDDMHKLVEGVDVVCLRGENERLQQHVAELTKACEQYQEHIREIDTACARLRGENELRQEAQVVAMEERDELCSALQEVLDFSLPVQNHIHKAKCEQVRVNARKLLKQHTATE